MITLWIHSFIETWTFCTLLKQEIEAEVRRMSRNHYLLLPSWRIENSSNFDTVVENRKVKSTCGVCKKKCNFQISQRFLLIWLVWQRTHLHRKYYWILCLPALFSISNCKSIADRDEIMKPRFKFVCDVFVLLVLFDDREGDSTKIRS